MNIRKKYKILLLLFIVIICTVCRTPQIVLPSSHSSFSSAYHITYNEKYSDTITEYNNNYYWFNFPKKDNIASLEIKIHCNFSSKLQYKIYDDKLNKQKSTGKIHSKDLIISLNSSNYQKNTRYFLVIHSNYKKIISYSMTMNYRYKEKNKPTKTPASVEFSPEKETVHSTPKSTHSICVKKITIKNHFIAVKSGKKFTIHCRVFPINSTNKKLIYKSGNSRIVRIKNGQLYAMKSGICTIKIISVSNKNVMTSCTVKVK